MAVVSGKKASTTIRPAEFMDLMGRAGILRGHAPAVVFAFTLVVASVAIAQNLLGPGLSTLYHVQDSEAYLKIANGDISGSMQPFVWRQLAPLISRASVSVFHIGMTQAFLWEGILSLIVLLAVVAMLLFRRAPTLFCLVAIAGLSIWASLFYNFMLPDLLNSMLLACFLLLLDKRHYLLASLMFFPLFVSRESSSLVLVCLFVAGLKQFKRRDYAVALISALAGNFTVRQLAAGSLPNREHANILIYLAGKTVWNLFRNFGLPLWNNLQTSYCAAPSARIALHLGGMTSIGFCSFNVAFLLHTLRTALGLFGLLPILFFFLWRNGQTPWKDESVLMRFCLLYGTISFLIAPLIGITYARTFVYGWPLFVIYVPSLAARNLTLRQTQATTFLVLHLAVTWANEMFLYGFTVAVELPLLCCFVCAYLCGWLLLAGQERLVPAQAI